MDKKHGQDFDMHLIVCGNDSAPGEHERKVLPEYRMSPDGILRFNRVTEPQSARNIFTNPDSALPHGSTLKFLQLNCVPTVRRHTGKPIIRNQEKTIRGNSVFLHSFK